MLRIWLVGLFFLSVAGYLIYFTVKNVVHPYEKYKFENSNEHGVVTLSTWEEAIKFRKYEAKKEFLENMIGVPTAFFLISGFFMVFVPTWIYLFFS